MSKSPWKDNDDAFTQMYDESVVISGTRGSKAFKQTIEAAVFVDYTGGATTDDMMDTDREDIHICCKPEDVAFLLKLQRGDMVERTAYNGVKYKISEVKRDAVAGWCIDARNI